MARWLTQQPGAELHLLIQTYIGDSPAISFFAIAAGLIMSLCCVTLILGMCSIYKRRQIGDRASSSDGDASPEGSRQGFFMTTRSKVYSKQRLMKHHEAREMEEEQLQEQGGKGNTEVKLSPHVWQRAILMGERCQRPTFSGLVLYDEKGNPLPRRLPS